MCSEGFPLLAARWGAREGRALAYVSRGALNDLAHAYRLGRLGKLSRERQLVEGDKLHRRTLHL